MNTAAFHDPVVARQGVLPRWSTEELCTHASWSSSATSNSNLFSSIFPPSNQLHKHYVRETAGEAEKSWLWSGLYIESDRRRRGGGARRWRWSREMGKRWKKRQACVCFFWWQNSSFIINPVVWSRESRFHSSLSFCVSGYTILKLQLRAGYFNMKGQSSVRSDHRAFLISAFFIPECYLLA